MLTTLSFVGSQGNFEGTRPGQTKWASMKLIPNKENSVLTNGTAVFGLPICGAFRIFMYPGKNDAINEEYQSKMDPTRNPIGKYSLQQSPGFAFPMAEYRSKVRAASPSVPFAQARNGPDSRQCLNGLMNRKNKTSREKQSFSSTRFLINESYRESSRMKMF